MEIVFFLRISFIYTPFFSNTSYLYLQGIPVQLGH